MMKSRFFRWLGVIAFVLVSLTTIALIVIMALNTDYPASRARQPELAIALVYGWILAVGVSLRLHARRKLSGPLIAWWVLMIAGPILAFLWVSGFGAQSGERAAGIALFAVLGVLVGVLSVVFGLSERRPPARSSASPGTYFVQDSKVDPELELRRALPELQSAPDRFMELAPRVASLHARVGHSDAALKLVDEVVARQPTADSYAARAGILETLGRKKDALIDLGRAIRRTEVDASLQSRLIWRANLAREIGAFDQALTDVNRCIRLFGESSVYYSMRALIHEAMHNPVAANIDSQKAFEMDMKARG